MRYAIITDHVVLNLYGERIYRQYKNEGKDVALLSFPAGEAFKTRSVKENLENQLLSLGYIRDTTIVALGGGVVIDLVGFLASTFCRGVPLILMPTTVVGMVDASIGGKTGVNGPGGKNMIGTFYNAAQTVIDYNFLHTLPEKEWFNGRVEMLKAALVWDRDFFENFSTFSDFQAIQRSRTIKEAIVSQDPYDRGVRRLLNLGHTFAHALEVLSHYRISHGEAVAFGVVFDARISYEMGVLSKDDFSQIQNVFPPIFLDFSCEEMLQKMRLDKKNSNNLLHCILLQKIGLATQSVVPENVIKRVLDDTRLCAGKNIQVG
jgi:3-dehydroquinate synthase